MKILRVGIALLVLAGGAFAFWFFSTPQPSLVTLSDARATVHEMGGTEAVAVAVSINNQGGPDRILRAASPEAQRAMLHGVTDARGAPVPAGGSPSFSLDGAHIMLMAIEGDLANGRLIPLTITFENAGDVTTKATLIAGAQGMVMSGGMNHVMDPAMGMEVPADKAPTIGVSAAPDGDGWRIRATVGRFRFAPDAMDGEHVPGEGHGHLYVGGLKMMRMTAPEALIGALPPGRHEVRVTLNTNNHMAYRTDAGPVSAVTFIEVEE